MCEALFPPQAPALVQDLALSTLFNAMALGDKIVFDVVQKAVLFSVHDVETIRYRQHILQNCLNHAALVREMYQIASEAIVNEKKNYFGFFSKYPTAILHRSIEVLQMFVGMLKKLKKIVEEQGGAIPSEGFTTFFAMLNRELSEDYFAMIQEHLRVLKFHDGELLSAKLCQGNKGTHYVLCKPLSKPPSWLEQLFIAQPPAYTFTISDRDESGARALSELRDRGINLVANALAQSTEHILNFFTMLRTELAFYVGCVNLHEQLTRLGAPLCFPLPVPVGERSLAFQGLYDVCLTLTMNQRVIGNDLRASGKDLVLITEANQGGKSTFLRSIGLAHLLMQCGMFVPAKTFRAPTCTGLFTHYKREEDATMESGKFDEELARMSEIVDHLTPHALLLFNEARYAGQRVRALVLPARDKTLSSALPEQGDLYLRTCAGAQR